MRASTNGTNGVWASNLTSRRRVLMHQHQATLDRIERDIHLIAKGVGLDYVDAGYVSNTSFRGFDQPRIMIDAHNPTGRTDSCGRGREQRPAAAAHLQNGCPGARPSASRVQPASRL